MWKKLNTKLLGNKTETQGMFVFPKVLLSFACSFNYAVIFLQKNTTALLGLLCSTQSYGVGEEIPF